VVWKQWNGSIYNIWRTTSIKPRLSFPMQALIPEDSGWHYMSSLDSGWHYMSSLDSGWHNMSSLDSGWYYVSSLDSGWHYMSSLDSGWHYMSSLDSGWHYMSSLDSGWHYMSSLDSGWLYIPSFLLDCIATNMWLLPYSCVNRKIKLDFIYILSVLPDTGGKTWVTVFLHLAIHWCMLFKVYRILN